MIKVQALYTWMCRSSMVATSLLAAAAACEASPAYLVKLRGGDLAVLNNSHLQRRDLRAPKKNGKPKR